MIHQYKNGGYNIVLDVCSGSVHVVDDVAYDIIEMFEVASREAVVSAIAHHTTGKADMNLLEMIIYVADYMEPNRNFPGVEQLRELAFTDIRAALKLGLEMTLEHLKNQGNEVSPESREALAWLNK